ncbi:MAG TPA: hypothetical protein VKR52_12720 [Terracidiphilus sp.]|nr:hypothetical protein [Terracidiphilus sp.]
MVEPFRLIRIAGCVSGLVVTLAAGTAFAQTAARPSSTHDDAQPAVVAAESAQPAADAALLTGSGESKRQEAAQAGAGQADQSSCPKIAETEVPLNQVVNARVDSWLDSGHLKPGKEFWVKVAFPIAFTECSLDGDSDVYGKVTSASGGKDGSELSIEFDRADCSGHKKDLKFWVIALLASPDELKSAHDAMPTAVKGGGRRISDTVGTTTEYDTLLNPGGTPNTVKPGIVVGYPKIKLDPSGGPGCSAKLTSTDKNIHLGTGTQMILMMGRAK